MKIFVKTLKGTNFEIDVKPEDTVPPPPLLSSPSISSFFFSSANRLVADVKRFIETSQGKTVYPAEQQMLIHQGKILKDDTTLDENKVAENSFLVIMLSKVAISSCDYLLMLNILIFVDL
ncbi:hypothetical protein B296_00052732 [Ensete ventricosum]|uniref:Ubiquitin-like domain-containing protein n=1 Tax=Ensete ventricosum TaxID=4639 RepID=A0A426YAZ8_ENSVE|nr:hypothetical protein B296_00052732 [Ensete ventricosum]